MNTGRNALARISRSVWELHRKIKEDPGNFDLRRDLLQFFHEGRLYLERKAGIPEDDRSFLLLQRSESVCCFLLHGAGGSPAEMRELGDFLYSHGCTVYAPRFNVGGSVNGRGRGFNFFSRSVKKEARGKDRLKNVYGWGGMLDEVEVAFDVARTYDPNTVVFGFSFGGTIALELTRRHGLKKVALVSPALVIRKMGRYLFFKTMKRLSRKIAMKISPSEYVVIDFIDRLKSMLGPLDSQLLVVMAVRDPVISTKSVSMLKKLSKNEKSRFIILNSSRHVLIRGEESREVFEYCRDFLSS